MNDQSQERDEDQKPESTLSEWLGWITYVVLAALALLGPPTATGSMGIYWGALIYFIVGIAWISFMPCTCMRGGFIASVIAMPIFLGGVVVPLIAGIKYVTSLF